VTLVLFLLLVAIPLIEIALFITVGGAIGLLPTLALVVLTAMVGSGLLRTQGLRTWYQARATMDRGEMPVHELFDGLCIFVSGLVLLTPGFFTDAVGLLLLIPFVRHFLAERLIKHMVVVQGGPPPQGDGRRPEDNSSRDVIIDAEYEEVDPEDERRR